MKLITNKTPAMKRIETEMNEEIEEVLRRLFVDENRTQQEIADKLNLSYPTVIKWFKLAGVRSRRLNIR